MSLKTRLLLSIMLLVAAVVIILSAVFVLRLGGIKLQDIQQRADMLAQQTKTVLLYRVQRVSAERPPPATLEQSRQMWSSIIEEDQELKQFLRATVASSSAVVEVLVTGAGGWVLASSNPSRPGTLRAPVADFGEFLRKSAVEKLKDVYAEGHEYQYTLPLGVQGRSEPLFSIQVIVSSVLLRQAVQPALLQLSLASLLALSITGIFAFIYANFAVRPLARISRSLERIISGEEDHAESVKLRDTAEFSTVQTKLSLLGKQVKGERQDAEAYRGNVEQMLERLEDVVLLFDSDGMLSMAGGAAERFLGLSRWQLLDQSLDQILPATTALGSFVQTAVELHRGVQDRPLTIDGSEGVQRRVLVSVELLTGFSRGGFMVTLKDAETREQITTQFQLAQRLTALGRLTGGVAHEIKNPLNAISLHLEVLKAGLEGREEVAEREIDIISRELSRLDRVVKTFLDFARPIDLNLVDVSLGGIVNEVAALVRPQAEQQGVELVVHKPAHPILIHGDRDMLQQAILNVVVNGVEATPAGGTLRIELEPVGDFAELVVKDSGPGIPQENLDKIFNLYFSTKKKGSGIGLAMTYRILQLHDANIRVDTAPGEGAAFHFRFLQTNPPSARRSAEENGDGAERQT